MSKHILVVDDEANIRRIAQVILSRAGYRISQASDGVEALEKVLEDRPDLILLDVMMPRMDGFEFLRRLKAAPDLEAIPVVMMTARVQDSDFHEGDRLGAAFYLAKPVSPVDMLAAVKRIFESGEPG